MGFYLLGTLQTSSSPGVLGSHFKTADLDGKSRKMQSFSVQTTDMKHHSSWAETGKNTLL